MEELLVKGANEHRRPLAEVNHLVEHLLGRIDARPAELLLDGGDTLGDDGAAALLGQDPRLLENLLIAGGVGDDVRTRPEYAVAARRVAGGDAGVRDGE